MGELHFCLLCPPCTALDQASSLSRLLAYVPGPTFGFVKLLASSGSHCTKWADEQHWQAGFESRLLPDLPPPLYPHFNWPSGFWPCVKSCLVGGSDKYYLRWLFNSKTLPAEEQQWLLIVGRIREFITFLGNISTKVSVIARLEFELAYFQDAVRHFSYHTRRTPACVCMRVTVKDWSTRSILITLALFVRQKEIYKMKGKRNDCFQSIKSSCFSWESSFEILF